MTFSGSLFFMVYLLIIWRTKKTVKTEIRLLLLKVTMFMYLVPFQLFKYLLPNWLWRNNWSNTNVYRLTENYIIHSQNDYVADMNVIFTWVWCIVSVTAAAIFAVYHLIRYWHMKKILKSCTVNIENDKQIKKLESIKKEIGLRRNIRFAFSEYFASPFMFGYFSPIVVLPACMEQAEEEQWDFVVRHELNHIKNKHLTVKFLAFVANFVHFFNPVVYLLRREICSMCEIDCDSKTVENYDTEWRRKYQEHIVDAAIRSRGLYAAGSIGLLGDRSKISTVQRRILEMNQSKGKKRIVSVVAALAAVLIGSASVWAYEPATQVEIDWGLNPNAEYTIDDNVEIEVDLNSGDIFTDNKGNVYDTSGAKRAICFHSLVDTTIKEHTRNSDGGCVTLYYDAERCTKCGYVKGKVYNGTTTTCVKCPH